MVPFSTPPFLIIYNAPRPLKPPSLHRSSSSMTKSSLSRTLPMLSGYNRKEKSLEELSRKFLQMFLHAEETCISLDRITAFLGVERRRIYDIINILESLGLVTRRGKNNYRWNGFQRVYDTVRSFEGLDLEEIKGLTCLSNFPVKREKSLKLLSIGFLGLFLRWKTTMSLEEAAKSLSENIKTEDHKIKTKIRRLYDIANVFKSLGLIRKTVLSNKKPAFHWVGVHGLDEFVESHNREEKKEEKKETQKSELDREFLMKCLMTLLEKPTEVAPSQQSHNFVTPTIKRTLTIIVNFISDLSAKLISLIKVPQNRGNANPRQSGTLTTEAGSLQGLRGVRLEGMWQ